MSWDISVLKFSRQYESVAEVPENEQLQLLGTRTAVHELVSSIFQKTNWNDPAWGIWHCHTGSIEFNLGDDDPSKSLMLHVRAGQEVVPLIVRLCLENGWQGIDCSNGNFIERSESPESGLNNWSSYRDQVIDHYQPGPKNDFAKNHSSKRLMAIFGAGVLIALSLAFWQYTLAPQGMLLYTPMPGTKVILTPSSAVGFFVATIGLSALSLLACLISFAISLVADRRWLSLAKETIILTLSFGMLATFTMITEKLWF